MVCSCQKPLIKCVFVVVLVMQNIGFKKMNDESFLKI